MSEIQDRLLIVDDDKHSCKHIAAVARRNEFEVAIALDRDQMKRKLLSFSPTLVLLDPHMLNSDGTRMLRLLHEFKIDAKIILLGNVDERKLMVATQIGEILGLNMSGSLQKPVSIDVVRNKLRTSKQAYGSIRKDNLAVAIDAGEIRPVYQPKVVCDAHGQWIVTETKVLARWHRDDTAGILPEDLLAVADETGLLPTMTDSLLEQLIDQLRHWKDRNLSLSACINLCPSILTDLSFPDRLDSMMQKKQLINSCLTLEFAETGITCNTGLAMKILTMLQTKGFGLAIDEFGSGYSSLEQLCRMPFSTLTIDTSLVTDIDASDDARRIVQAFILLGHKLGLSVCAAGVRSLRTFHELAELGCDSLQGAYVGPPVSAEQLEERVRDWNPVTTVPTDGANSDKSPRN